VISPPSNTNIWIAAGITDMRRGFTGLSAAAQTVLEQNPYSGHVFASTGEGQSERPRPAWRYRTSLRKNVRIS
jgi:transposase